MRTAVALLLLFAPAAAGAKDLMLRQRTYGPAGPSAANEQRQYYSGDKLVVDDEGMRSILDVGARTFTLIDKRKKTYTVTAFDELRRNGERAMKALDGLPPEARRMLGLDGATVRATGRSEQIAGYTAKEYAVAAGTSSGAVWVTEEIRLPEGARDWEKLAGSLGTSGRPGGALQAEMTKVDGVPLRMSLRIALGPQKIETTTEVVEVREDPPPAGMLTVPDGYQRTARARAE